jgi:hypothetical protein
MSFNAEGLVETGRRNLTDDFRRQICLFKNYTVLSGFGGKRLE